MAHLALPLLAGAALIAAAGAAAVLQRRRNRDPDVQRPEPHSLVRVLRSEEELREAVDRAVRFERSLADRARTRTRRYEDMVHPAPIAHIEDALAARAEVVAEDPAPRSA